MTLPNFWLGGPPGVMERISKIRQYSIKAFFPTLIKISKFILTKVSNILTDMKPLFSFSFKCIRQMKLIKKNFLIYFCVLNCLVICKSSSQKTNLKAVQLWYSSRATRLDSFLYFKAKSCFGLSYIWLDWRHLFTSPR